MALVLDTGVIDAALDSNDPDHSSCASPIRDSEEQLVIPQPVLVEVDNWMRKLASVDVWLAFCQDIHAGAYSLWPADASLVLAAAEVQSRFADQDLVL
jgi:predicted nucleic acid-binding protein